MAVSSHFGIGLFASLTFLLYLAFFGLVVCFMISAIRFFKRKNQNDEELKNKLDELISVLKKNKE